MRFSKKAVKNYKKKIAFASFYTILNQGIKSPEDD